MKERRDMRRRKIKERREEERDMMRRKMEKRREDI